MANQNKTDIGLIGLAVMGENLALNMESKGWHVSVYNRTVPGVEEGVVDRFMNGRAKGKNIEGFTDIKAFVDSIAIPRKIMMMVRAGSPVDELMDQLFPLLSPGDILIDGGNSNYEDTNRRVKLAESKGFLFVGSGVSGGEEGALNGASIMPGGSEQAWPEVKPILQSIAAKAPDGTPCCQWVGPAGSGHFVKMIHNGIEYGDMQLIADFGGTMLWPMIALSNIAQGSAVLGMIYRFLKTGRFKRILFLVDRTALGEQALDVFKEVKLGDLMPLADIYNIKGLEDKEIERETRIQVATVQGMVKRILYNDGETMPAVNDYDLIIIDEAHRGYLLDKEMGDTELLYRDQRDYQSKYRSVIEYFDAVKIALTATPALQTTEIFGQPVFKYLIPPACLEPGRIGFNLVNILLKDSLNAVQLSF